jgi:two-component system NtrC family sensor kinase
MGDSPAASEERASGDPAPALPSLDAPVPFAHRLSTKVLGVVALLAVAALVAVWIAERRFSNHMVTEVGRSTALLGDALQVATKDSMLAAAPGHGYEALQEIATLQGIDLVRVIDERGRVRFSTDAAEIGSTVGKEQITCAPCHGDRALPLSRAPTGERQRLETGPQGHRLVMVTPIANDRSCATSWCHVHPPGRQVLGLLELGVSLERVEAGVVSFRRGYLALLALTIVTVTGLLYLFLRSEILSPVAALVEGTRRVARDQLDVQVRVHSQGEMGRLAASFNDMTQSVSRLEEELNGLLANLEEQVQARTADLRAAQEQLVRTEKLSSLGKLSASVAHEINNPLAGILTFAKLVSRTLAEGPPDDARRAVLMRNLALVEREAQRCSAIVRNLLDFARERPMAVKRVDANAAIEEALSLISNQVSIQGVSIERFLEPLPPVSADYGQLRQAFVNVAMNACEAMGKSGQLRISSRVVDGAIAIDFADTGPGMPAELVNRIFDPFFTTKEKGTGLGLSVVYGIVQRHAGTIEVASVEGQGTTFTLRLPAAPPEAEPVAGRPAAA